MNHSPWMLTASGKTYYLGGVGMAHNEYVASDIAHALAQINRYNGHAKRPYSVAEHSLVCADIAKHLGLPPVVQLACLMHDAHEAYTGDCTSPAKQALGPAWAAFERSHSSPLRRWFGLSTTFLTNRAAIHQIDLMALATERRDLMRWEPGTSEPWDVIDTPGSIVPPTDWINLARLSRQHTDWTQWRDDWLYHFHTLRTRIHNQVASIPHHTDTTEAPHHGN